MHPDLTDHSRLLSAIDHVIKDTDKKFDECLIEHFMGYLSTEEYDTHAVIDRVKSYMEHKAFLMLNQARALKILQSTLQNYICRERDIEFDLTRPHLEAMWNILDVLVLNKDLSAMTVFLSICTGLIKSDTGYSWLMSQRVEPPIRLMVHEIADITSLLSYYIKTCNNYHTKNKAERLLKNIMLSPKQASQPPTTLLKLIEDLIKSCSMSMISILIDIAKNRPEIAEELFPRANVADLVQQTFVALLRRPDSTSEVYGKTFNQLSLCLSFINPPMSWRTIVERLESKKRIESIIIFLCNSKTFDEQKENLMLAFCLYPVLESCKTEDVKPLIERLHIDRLHSELLDQNKSHRLLTFCLSQIRQLAERKESRPSEFTYILIFDILILFITNHFNDPKQYKNVMEACSILICLEALFYKDHHLKKIINQVHKMISCMTQHDEQTKPIVLELMKVLRAAQSSLRYGSKLETIDKTMDLAFQFKDHDILNEFALFFVTEYLPLNQDDKGSKSIKLVWDHMYLEAKDTDHRELLGNLATLLINIDLEAYNSALDLVGIRRHHDIPSIIGDLLIEKAAVVPTVERIIETLDMLGDPESNVNGAISTGYVSRLDSPTLSRSVKKCLDRLVGGLCATIKGESSEETRMKTFKIINNLIFDMPLNETDDWVITERLTNNGILETIFDVSQGSMYPPRLRRRAVFRLAFLRTFLKISVMEKTLLNNHSDEIDEVRRNKISKLVKFYEGTGYLLWDLKDENPEEVEVYSFSLSSLVDDILNYELISDGIVDCY